MRVQSASALAEQVANDPKLQKQIKADSVTAIADLAAPLFATPHWTVQTSGVNVRLRGVSAVSQSVVCASGAG